MRTIGKGLAITAIALAVGGAGLAVAQTGGPGDGPGYGRPGLGYGMMGSGPGFVHGGGSGMMRGPGGGSFGDPVARLESMKAELGIRPEQQPAWGAYAKVVQDAAAQMQAIRGSIDPDKLRSMDWAEHQAFMAKMFDQRAASFRAVQTAGSKLIAALDDGQKAHLLSVGATGGPGAAGWYGCGPAAMGPGYGMMGPHGGWAGNWMMGDGAGPGYRMMGR